MSNKKIAFISFGLIFLILVGVLFVNLNTEKSKKSQKKENIEDREDRKENNDSEVGQEVSDDFQRVLDWDGGNKFELEEDGQDMVISHDAGYNFKIPLNWYVKENDFIAFSNKADNCRINIEETETQSGVKELINYLREEEGEQKKEGDLETSLRTDDEGNNFLVMIDNKNEEFTAESLISDDKSIFISAHSSEEVDYCKEYFNKFLNN